MAVWLFRAGLIVVGVSILLLTPVADLLPVDLWLWVKGLSQPKGGGLHIQVVPRLSSCIVEYGFIAVGIVMAAVGYFLREAD